MTASANALIAPTPDRYTSPLAELALYGITQCHFVGRKLSDRVGANAMANLLGGSTPQESPPPDTGAVLTASSPAISHPRQLLELSRKQIDLTEYGQAIVLAHTACDVALEVGLSVAMDKAHMRELLRNTILRKFGPTAARRKLYTAITGIKIPKTIWVPFKASVEVRNDIIRCGRPVDKTQADNSYFAAESLVRYLETKPIRQTLDLPPTGENYEEAVGKTRGVQDHYKEGSGEA